MKNFRVLLMIAGVLLWAAALVLGRLVIGDYDPNDLWAPILALQSLGSILFVIGFSLFLAKAISDKYYNNKNNVYKKS